MLITKMKQFCHSGINIRSAEGIVPGIRSFDFDSENKVPINYSMCFYLLTFFFRRAKFVVQKGSHQTVNLIKLFELPCERQKIEKIHLLQNVFRIEVIHKVVRSKSGNWNSNEKEPGKHRTSNWQKDGKRKWNRLMTSNVLKHNCI